MPCTLPYWKAVAIAHDQLVNAWCRGWPDETLSSRAYRLSASGKTHWPRRIIDAVFFWDREGARRHCELSFESECKLKQLPPEARGGKDDRE